MITITIKSFLSPDEPLAGFHRDEPFALDVPAGITLEEFTRTFFSQRLNQIGVMAVNGALASGETVLAAGDAIDVYPLLEGG